MKNLRKLVIASFMLVIAFVAVVSSTYAWFTNGTTAEVNNITISVEQADKSLLVSKDNTNWDNVIDFQYEGMMYPVTMVTSSGNVSQFKHLQWGDHLVPEYVDATALEDFYGFTTDPGNEASQADQDKYARYVAEHAKTGNARTQGYIEFDLYFQITVEKAADWGETTLKVDLRNLAATKNNATNDEALSSFRLAIADVVAGGAGHLIKMYEVEDSNAGTYGEGDQFDGNSAWMAKCKDAGFVNLIAAVEAQGENPAVPAHYEMVQQYVDSAYDSANILAYDSATDSYEFELEAATAGLVYVASSDGLTRTYHLRFYAWMEGWDGDCINAASGVEYVFGLKFMVE